MQQLTYLVALADHGHFGKAAVACHVTQPGLSNQLRELERRLGCALVERSPRAVRLTDAGTVIAERARRVLRDVDDLADVARSASAALAGPLRIGLIPTVAPYVLPQVVRLVLEEHPAAALHVTEERTADLLVGLRAGELDVVVVALPLSGTDLAYTTLVEDPFFLAVASRHPLASAEEVSIDQLRTQQVLLLDEGHCLRDQALAICSIVGTISTSVAATSLPTLVQMVAAGQGVTVLPSTAASVEAGKGRGICLVPLSDAPKRSLALVWRASSPRRDLYRDLALLLAPLFGELASRGSGEAVTVFREFVDPTGPVELRPASAQLRRPTRAGSARPAPANQCPRPAGLG